MANETIGRIFCPLVKKMADVRRDKRGKFYYVSEAGLITPKSPAGQEWMLENAELFSLDERGEINAKPVYQGRRIIDEEGQEPVTHEPVSSVVDQDEEVVNQEETWPTII